MTAVRQRNSRPPTFQLLTLGVVAGLLSLSFQNCGADFTTDSAGEESLLSINQQLPVAATLHFSTRSPESLEANRSGRILRWRDLSSQSVHLYPPLMTNSTSVDLNRAPRITDEDDSGRRWLRFETLANNTTPAILAPAVSDLRYFESDQATVSIVFRLPEFVGTPNQGLRLFDLNSPAAGAGMGYLTVDLIMRDATNAYIRAYYWYDPTSHLMLWTEDVPLTDLRARPQVLTLRFGSSVSQGIRMALGQSLSDSTYTEASSRVQQVGTPPPLPSASRLFSVGSPYQAASRIEVGEVLYFKAALSDRDFGSIHSYLMKIWLGQGMGAQPTPPPPSPTPNPSPSPTPATVTFAQISPIFSKSLGGQTCVACHASELGSRTAILQASRNSRSFVVPNNAAGSSLIRSVRKQAGVSAMPTNGSSVVEADIQLLEQWINQGAN